MRVLAIDPGPVESAYALIDAETRRPVAVGKVDNHDLRDMLPGLCYEASASAVEMVASYGMPVGKEVFETCVWIGRFIEASGCSLAPIVRLDVKLHHCHSSKASDSNIAQALIDRFESGEPNRGKGTKDAPGWFHGFRADIWQAYALAVLIADRTEGEPA